MKYIHTLTMMLLVTLVSAQELTYQDGIISYDGEDVQTIDVILDPNVETIKDKFGDWMDDNYDIDFDGKKLLFFDSEFMTANGVVIPQISNKKIDLRVKVDETSTGLTELNVFASFGYNNWILEDVHPSEYAALRGIVYDFVKEYLPEYYMERIEDSEVVVDELTDKRTGISDSISNNDEEIRELEKENAGLRKKLKENQKKIMASKNVLKTRNAEYKKAKAKVSDLRNN